VNGESKNPFDMLLDSIRVIVREEITAAIGSGKHDEPDRLLTPEETAAILDVDVRWLYRHAAKLPFTRRISRKNLRFSEAGLRRWLAAKKLTPDR
jgi:predicted DNA-binding transcriptional regulator AlpA